MHFTDEVREPRERLYASLGLEYDKPLCHYLARLNGQPVAISSLFVGHQVAGLYCVAVLPEVRRQGIGTAIMLAPLYDAQTLGCHIAVLAPSRESQTMYQRIGFELYPDTTNSYYVLP